MKEAKKLYHIEAMSDEHILVGTDVKARNEEEAVKTMKLVFGEKINKDTIFLIVSENIQKNIINWKLYLKIKFLKSINYFKIKGSIIN